MQSGKLDRRATFERPVSTPDPVYGTPVTTWVPVAYAPGSPQVAEVFRVNIQDVLPSRSELVRQGLATFKDQTRLRMRWRADIDSSQRVTLHGDTDVLYQIIAGPVEIGGRKRGLEIMIERYATQGAQNV